MPSFTRQRQSVPFGPAAQEFVRSSWVRPRWELPALFWNTPTPEMAVRAAAEGVLKLLPKIGGKACAHLRALESPLRLFVR